MDDFEFKPLTEGLGFHKKIIDLKEEQSGPTNLSNMSSLSSTGILPKARSGLSADGGLGATSSAGPKISLGAQKVSSRPTTLSQPPTTQRPTTPRSPLKNSNIQSPQPPSWSPALSGKTFAESIETPIAKPQWVPVAVSWPASIFDSTMILGMTLLFSAVVFAITGINLSDLIEMLRDDPAAQFASVILLVGVLEIYAVGCRTFFGKTLGEWAFDFRLGSVEDQQSVIYPVMVAWRALLLTLTGFVILPLIGTILNRDVTGLLTGVDLYADKR